MRIVFIAAALTAAAVGSAYADHYSRVVDKMWSKSESPGCCAPGYEGEDPDHFAEQGSKLLGSGPEGWGPGQSWEGMGGSLGKNSFQDSFSGPRNGKLDKGYYGTGRGARDGNGG